MSEATPVVSAGHWNSVLAWGGRNGEDPGAANRPAELTRSLLLTANHRHIGFVQTSTSWEGTMCICHSERERKHREFPTAPALLSDIPMEGTQS